MAKDLNLFSVRNYIMSLYLIFIREVQIITWKGVRNTCWHFEDLPLLQISDFTNLVQNITTECAKLTI